MGTVSILETTVERRRDGRHERASAGRRPRGGTSPDAAVRHPGVPSGPGVELAAAGKENKSTPSRAVDGDTVIRVLAAVVVLAVAAFAAVVSYLHVFDLSTHHGQSGTAARLLPLSVDGLIAAASLLSGGRQGVV
jgi:Protein of unknown function (DUF2637)